MLFIPLKKFLEKNIPTEIANKHIYVKSRIDAGRMDMLLKVKTAEVRGNCLIIETIPGIVVAAALGTSHFVNPDRPDAKHMFVLNPNFLHPEKIVGREFCFNGYVGVETEK